MHVPTGSLTTKKRLPMMRSLRPIGRLGRDHLGKRLITIADYFPLKYMAFC